MNDVPGSTCWPSYDERAGTARRPERGCWLPAAQLRLRVEKDTGQVEAAGFDTPK